MMFTTVRYFGSISPSLGSFIPRRPNMSAIRSGILRLVSIGAYLASGRNLEVQMFAGGIVVALTHGVLLCLFAAIAQMFRCLGRR